MGRLSDWNNRLRGKPTRREKRKINRARARAESIKRTQRANLQAQQRATIGASREAISRRRARITPRGAGNKTLAGTIGV